MVIYSYRCIEIDFQSSELWINGIYYGSSSRALSLIFTSIRFLFNFPSKTNRAFNKTLCYKDVFWTTRLTRVKYWKHKWGTTRTKETNNKIDNFLLCSLFPFSSFENAFMASVSCSRDQNSYVEAFPHHSFGIREKETKK